MPGQRCNLYLVRGARAPAANPSWELRAARRSTAPTGRVTPGPAENSSLAEERAQMLHRKSSRTGGDLPEITRPLPRSGRAVASPRGEALRAAGTAGRTEGEREGGRQGKGEREREAGLRQQQGGAPSLAIRATACPRKRHGAALYPGKKTASSKTKRRSSWGAEEEEEEEEEKQGRRREASTTPANKALCCDSLPFRPRPPGLRQEEQGKGRRGKAMQGRHGASTGEAASCPHLPGAPPDHFSAARSPTVRIEDQCQTYCGCTNHSQC
ncbi:unnamed protein product [Prorocentrum cordatum]|uniref:Uncharacterized protein n=1 Tax=Prorocentrum cordatum TaxID=2364126 RepID=A0ABN9SH72_9DINO|nr:unnamed protein product [Polarella glacialis]